jgi:hypothetical protein
MSKIAGYNSQITTAHWGFAGTAGPIDGTVPVLVAPFGGATIKAAYAYTTAAVAGHASNYLAVTLLNMGTAGTAVAGTVATGPGTATGFSPPAPAAMTISTSTDELTAGQVLVAVFDVNGTIAPKEAGVAVEWVNGKG